MAAPSASQLYEIARRITRRRRPRPRALDGHPSGALRSPFDVLAIASLATMPPLRPSAASEHLARELICFALIAGVAACVVALSALALATTVRHRRLLS